MKNRRPVQEAHENFIVDEFIAWWEDTNGEVFKVIDRPQPPEAIVRSKHRITWIEVTDAFYSPKWAQDLFSNATPEETHKPMGTGPYVDMDSNMAEVFVELLKKKLSKESYSGTYHIHGPGILLVGMQTPWFDEGTCRMMRDKCRITEWQTDRGYFAHIFIFYSSLNRLTFQEWKYSAKVTS